MRTLKSGGGRLRNLTIDGLVHTRQVRGDRLQRECHDSIQRGDTDYRQHVRIASNGL